MSHPFIIDPPEIEPSAYWRQRREAEKRLSEIGAILFRGSRARMGAAGKPVRCTWPDGTTVVYPTMSAAAEAVGSKCSNLAVAIRRNGKYKGMMFVKI